MLPSDLTAINHHLETATPQEILTWAWYKFRVKVAATSSFQTQSAPLLHMISKTVPQLPILFLDTGFHFSETLLYRDRLIKKWKLNIQVIKPNMGHSRFKQQYGDLYRNNPDLCCYINKVEPLHNAMQSLDAWISGIRRDQTADRTHTAIVGLQPNGLVKICPLANWTRKQVWQYIHDHQLPEHPLLAQGYLSIGCEPCTRPIIEGQDDRDGRWAGQDKTECGLHIPREQYRLEIKK